MRPVPATCGGVVRDRVAWPNSGSAEASPSHVRARRGDSRLDGGGGEGGGGCRRGGGAGGAARREGRAAGRSLPAGPGGLGATADRTLASPAEAYGGFGESVAGAGDVDGDGYADLVVGASGVSSNAGAAYVYLGSPSGVGATATRTLAGSAGAGFGQASCTRAVACMVACVPWDRISSCARP